MKNKQVTFAEIVQQEIALTLDHLNCILRQR
jgi:hypothetical protein